MKFQVFFKNSYFNENSHDKILKFFQIFSIGFIFDSFFIVNFRNKLGFFNIFIQINWIMPVLKKYILNIKLKVFWYLLELEPMNFVQNPHKLQYAAIPWKCCTKRNFLQDTRVVQKRLDVEIQ